MSNFTLSGELVSIGDMPPEDVPQMIGVPHISIRMVDGRMVTLTGLTRDECRAVSKEFMAPITLTVHGEQR